MGGNKMKKGRRLSILLLAIMLVSILLSVW